MLHTWIKNMNKIFVDTDVILDLLARRLPHFHFSAVLFTFAEMKKLELYTSPLIFANTFYILRKQKKQKRHCESYGSLFI